MVKGVSKQVIVVHSPDPKMFEQAIFILRERSVGEEGITEEALMREAQRLIRAGTGKKRGHRDFLRGALWAVAGALLTGSAWVLWLVF